MPDQVLELALEVSFEPEADEEQQEEATLHLRRRLPELDVESVTRPSAGKTTGGSRAVDPATIGRRLSCASVQ